MNELQILENNNERVLTTKQLANEQNNKLQIINQQEVLGKDFKIYGAFDNPLFLARDVADWIEYDISKVGQMLKNIEEEEKIISPIYYSGQIRNMYLLTEDGLYEVLMQSRKPIAKQFKKEVKKILKDIRKHGMYATDELLDNPDLLIKVATKLKEEKAARLEAENKVKVLEPKADFYDTVIENDSTFDMAKTAKILNIKGLGRNNLLAFLRGKGILQKDNTPYQEYVDRGYFKVVECVNIKNDKINYKTVCFNKGIEYIKKLLSEN